VNRSSGPGARLPAIVLAASVVLGANGARAGDDNAPPAPESATEKIVDAEARRLFELGLHYFKLGEHATAIEHFEAAYQRSSAPGLLYNLAQAHRLNGACGPALDFYRRYLATNPTGKKRERTEARIADMEGCLRASAAETSAEPIAPADERPIEVSAAPPPGRDAATVETPPSLAAPYQRKPRVTYALATGGTAVALGFASGYFAWKADRAADRTSAQNWQRPWNMEAAGIESAGRRDERIAVVTGLAALVAAGVATWILLRE
jgi:hypothetical protein